MSSKSDKIVAGTMIAGALAGAVWAGIELWPSSDTPVPPQPDPAATVTVPDAATTPEQATKPEQESKPVPTPLSVPTTQHFNESGKEFVLVCMQGMSRDREAHLTAADRKKAATYEAGMMKVAEELTAKPIPELAQHFAAHYAVVLKIIAWDQSITKVGVDKIDILPHRTLEGQACPRDALPVTKFPVP